MRADSSAELEARAISEQTVLERLAALDAKLDRVLRTLEAPSVSDEPLLTAKELAKRLGVGIGHVYDNRDAYGVIRLGTGPKPHLRFPADAASARPSRASDRLARKRPQHRRPLR